MKNKKLLFLTLLALSMSINLQINTRAAETTSNGNLSYTGGPLTIVRASNFDYGEQKITSKDMNYDANGGIIVSDLRGTGSGWTLQVEQVNDFHTDDGKKLPGTEIWLNDFGNYSWLDKPSPDDGGPISPGGGRTPPPDAPTGYSITLKPDTGLQNVLIAKKGQGMMQWTYLFNYNVPGGAGTLLSVPGKVTKYAKQYTTDIHWVLSDTPQP